MLTPFRGVGGGFPAYILINGKCYEFNNGACSCWVIRMPCGQWFDIRGEDENLGLPTLLCNLREIWGATGSLHKTWILGDTYAACMENGGTVRLRHD